MTSHERYQHLRSLPLKRIAVWRPVKLGDFLLAVPALRALRAAFPDARIDYVGLPWSRECVPRFHAYLDGFVKFPGLPGLPEREWKTASVMHFLRRMQQSSYDLVIQMQCNGRIVNPFVTLCNSTVTTGFADNTSFAPHQEWFMPYSEHEHEVKRLLNLLQFLGIDATDGRLEFPVTPHDHDELQRMPELNGLRRPYACVHAGASTELWPEAHFAQVADACASKGYDVVLTGTYGERRIVQAVAQRMRATPRVLAGKTSLGSLAALLKDAAMCIGNDAGVTHLANALEVPSVTICSADSSVQRIALDPRRHARVAGPSATPATVVRALRLVDVQLA